MADAQDILDKLRERAITDLSKLSYFGMGAAGSGIAFAFHETSDRQLGWSLLPIGIACLAWAGSFACGILHAEQQVRLTNLDQLGARQQLQGDGLTDEQTRRYKKRSRNASRLFYGQMWTLLAGAFAYGAGHIMHIASALPHC